MAIEIERKFLVDINMVKPFLHSPQDIEQGYLASGKNVTVRVRLIKGIGAYITVKGPGLEKRAEYEYTVPLRDAEQMMEMCSLRLSKTRWHVGHGGWTWEIDEFHGPLNGLWMAEIEIQSEEDKVMIPNWAVREVTQDARYTNVSLARDGIPT